MNYSELLQLAKGWGNFIFDRVIIWRLPSTSHREAILFNRLYVKLHIKLANLWSDEQKSHEATVKDKVAQQVEVKKS